MKQFIIHLHEPNLSLKVATDHESGWYGKFSLDKMDEADSWQI